MGQKNPIEYVYKIAKSIESRFLPPFFLPIGFFAPFFVHQGGQKNPVSTVSVKLTITSVAEGRLQTRLCARPHKS